MPSVMGSIGLCSRFTKDSFKHSRRIWGGGGVDFCKRSVWGVHKDSARIRLGKQPLGF